MNEPQSQPQPEQRSGKLKWFLVCGCLATLLACVGFSVALTYGVMGAIKSSNAYQGAMAQAQASTAVAQALGTPLEEGFFVQGNINVTSTSGQADLTIPISGPKGEGIIRVQATKSGGKWSYSLLKVVVTESGEEIDLQNQGD